MIFKRPIPQVERVFLFSGHTEAGGETATQERRRSTIQMELTHEAEEGQSQTGNDEGRIA